MEDQKSAFQLFCEENYYSETKGSKTITKAKGERIIKVLTNDPAAADYSPKFRHWVKQRGFKGFESVIEDYVPDSLKKVCHVLLYCVSFGTFVGLVYLNYSDVGICNAVKMIWSM